MMSENDGKKRKRLSTHSSPIKIKKLQQSISKFIVSEDSSINKASATSIEYFKCPHCKTMLSITKIVAHSEACTATTVTPIPEISNKNVKIKNAFETLIASEKSNRPICYLFTMQVIDGRLHPHFSLANEDDSLKENEDTWTATTKVNKFKNELFLPASCEQHKSVLIKLRTNIPQSTAEQSPHLPFSLESSPPASLLKSMIQKGIRRRQTQKVLKLSATLSVVSLQELLRRLPVICVEDGLLHPGVVVVVWLMMAHSKGYEPPQWLVDACLLVAAETSQCEYRDCHPANEVGTADDTTTDDLIQDDAHMLNETTPVLVGNIINPSVRTLVASLLLRAGFGGMNEDIRMLEDYASIWHRRLTLVARTNNIDCHSNHMELALLPSLHSQTGLLGTCLSPVYLAGIDNGAWGKPLSRVYGCTTREFVAPSTTLNSSVDMDGVRTLCQAIHAIYSSYEGTEHHQSRYISGSQDLVAEGIDFHCDWGLVPHVLEQYTSGGIKEQGNNGMIKLTEDRVKQAVWRFRSSINTHHLWPVVQGEARRLYEEWRVMEAGEKQLLCSVWRVICPVVNAYCARKLANFDRKLTAHLSSHQIL